MNWQGVIALLPLLIPVAVWAFLKVREPPVRSSKVRNMEGASSSTSTQVVKAFTSGGAISSSAQRTWVKDVLQGEHECLLFAYIEEMHGRDKPWGAFLDAGTGDHSLGWAGSLNVTELVAITGDEGQLDDMKRKFAVKAPHAELLCGNWNDDELLEGRHFDVVLADYLLGALDGFAPYYQDLLLPRLIKTMKPDGWLFFVGTEPIPEKCEGKAQQLIADVCRTRDACILLGGDRRRPYREYPQEWVVRHMEKAGLVVVGVGSFPIVHTTRQVLRQVGVAERKLQYMQGELREGMTQHLKQLREKVENTDWRGVKLGVDYVIAAKIKK